MNGESVAPSISLHEGRFARLEAIEWWDQQRLHAARVLVIGAGALGNEVLKNLALLGVGHVAIVDQDHVELSNLSRSVLFRESDEGLPKAECAARALRSIYPGMKVTPLVGNLLADIGLGWFRWADVVVGALDNREARVFTNSACARTERVWMDGGIEVMQGIVRGFGPPATACYECTMSSVDWDLLAKRRSCSLIARRASAARGVPTTPLTASIIGAMQAQEVVKILHGMEALVGRGYLVEGAQHSGYPVNYRIHPDCPWHETQPPIIALPDCGSDTPLATIVAAANERLGAPCQALDLSRELVEKMECAACGNSAPVWRPVEHVREDELHCPQCQAESAPVFIHSIALGGQRAEGSHTALQLTPRQIGLPTWDIIWARQGDEVIGLELAADAPT